MSRICGIELKSSEAILMVLKCEYDGIEYVDIVPRKIKLGDDESSESVNSFYDSVVDFIKDNQIDIIVIKKRAKKGKMAGGAVSFKMEALIQLNGISEVEFSYSHFKTIKMASDDLSSIPQMRDILFPISFIG